MIKLLDLFVFFLANFGFAWIVTQSVLLQDLREIISNTLKKKDDFFLFRKLNYLITCIYCASVWTSIILFNFLSKISIIEIESNWYDLLLIVCIAPAATMFFVNNLLERWGAEAHHEELSDLILEGEENERTE